MMWWGFFFEDIILIWKFHEQMKSCSWNYLKCFGTFRGDHIQYKLEDIEGWPSEYSTHIEISYDSYV